MINPADLHDLGHLHGGSTGQIIMDAADEIKHLRFLLANANDQVTAWAEWAETAIRDFTTLTIEKENRCSSESST
jgi:hypothetical protein